MSNQKGNSTVFTLEKKKNERSVKNKLITVEKDSLEEYCHKTGEICDLTYCHKFKKQLSFKKSKTKH